MTKKIIDISEHNGIVNWEQVKPNIDGTILRCGFGDDVISQDDKQFARNLTECERLGIPKGVYLYSYATTEAQARSELAHILRLIKGHKFEYPIYLDCEESGTQWFAPTACKIICEGIKSAGYTAGVYASLSWWNSYLTSVTNYTRWIAQWGSACTYTSTYDMWQYSETGRVNGINGYVDMNYCYKDFNSVKTNSVNNTTNTVTNNTDSNINVNKKSLDVTYQVYIDSKGWLPVVKNLEDYAGIDGQSIKGIRVYLNGDTLAVETHQLNNGNIDKLRIYAGKHTVKYRVRNVGSKDYLSWMENKKSTDGSNDDYAGISGEAIDRVQITIKN